MTHTFVMDSILANLAPFVFESKTHTIEGIPITKIHVRRRDFIECFSRFGRIVDCYIKWSPDITGTALFAFITYQNVSDALRARFSDARIKGAQLKVSAADSWHQDKQIPRPSNFSKTKRTYTNRKANTKLKVECVQDENNILNVLNEYCFMKIFSYLSVHQLVYSERVSKRWNYLVHERYKSILEFKTSTWDMRTLFPKTNMLHSLLKKIGSNLKILHIDSELAIYDFRTPYIIAKLCPNLERLSVLKLESRNWNDVIKKCCNLESLEFYSCHGIKDSTFKGCSANLKELVFSNMGIPLGNFLTNINVNNLTKLGFIDVPIKEYQCIKSFAYLHNLKELHLESLTVTDNCVFQILKLHPQLETLNVSRLNMSSGLDPITDMKDLKALNLHSNTAVNDDLLIAICANCTKLTHLNIANDSEVYPRITSDGIRKIFSLKYLEVLNMSNIEVGEQLLELGRFGKGCKLKKLIVRKNHVLMKEIVCSVLLSCPSIEYFDFFDCYYIDSSIIIPIRDILHSNASQKGCIPNRITLNFSLNEFLDFKESEVALCPCIKLKYEQYNQVLAYYSSDEFDQIDDDFDDSDAQFFGSDDSFEYFSDN